MTRRLAWLLVFAALSGCQCRPSGPVDPIALGLRVSPQSIDFGRALEGTTQSATLTLTAETRAAVSVALSTAAPFGSPDHAEVPGGGDTSITVTFAAGAELAEGALQLKVGDLTALVPLRGVGVRPPTCKPSAECIVSTYSLEEDRCIESQAADDAPCDPASLCLEQGRCHSGQCLGIARRCDDNDACTDDACAMDIGCVHTVHTCPAPTAVCKVATCDAQLGCGVGPAPDLQACGRVDCVEVNFCLHGACTQEPTPEGLPCSAAIACLPEAQCHHQQCTRANEGDWNPTWAARLPGQPTGELASSGATLFFSICGSVSDAGVDGGVDDAGGVVCGLSSYTGTGFERFTTAYDDGLPREVLALNDDGVVLARDGGLEVRASNSGQLRVDLPFGGRREQVVVQSSSVITQDDAGLRLRSVDGGARFWSGDESAELARGEALFTWNADSGLLTRFDFLDDGGLTTSSTSLGSGHSPRLAVAGSTLVLGGEGRAQLGADGDAGWVSFDWLDAGTWQISEEQTLVSALATDVFYERCDGGVCSPWVRVFDTELGGLLWEAPLLSPRSNGTVLNRALVAGPLGGFVDVVRFEDPDGGRRAEFQFFADGQRKALCRLAEGDLELAHLSAGALVVTARRSDGGLMLESYDLGGLSGADFGWPTMHGVGGTRSDGR